MNTVGGVEPFKGSTEFGLRVINILVTMGTKELVPLRLHDRRCDIVIGRAKSSRTLIFELLAADSRVLRKGRPRTPPGPEGSNGTGCHPVPQGCLAIIDEQLRRHKDFAISDILRRAALST